MNARSRAHGTRGRKHDPRPEPGCRRSRQKQRVVAVVVVSGSPTGAKKVQIRTQTPPPHGQLQIVFLSMREACVYFTMGLLLKPPSMRDRNTYHAQLEKAGISRKSSISLSIFWGFELFQRPGTLVGFCAWGAVSEWVTTVVSWRLLVAAGLSDRLPDPPAQV